jgi:hypothetical protein
MPWDIRLDTDVNAIVNNVLDAERPLVDSMRRRLGNVYARAVRLAPVKTGKYKRSLGFTVGLTAGGEIEARITADVPYAWYINRGYTVRTTIFEPANRAADLVLKDTADRWGV